MITQSNDPIDAPRFPPSKRLKSRSGGNSESLYQPIMREFYERLKETPFLALRVIFTNGQSVIVQHPAEVEPHINYFYLLLSTPDGVKVSVSARNIGRLELVPTVLMDQNSV